MTLFKKKKQPKFTENELTAIKIVVDGYIKSMDKKPQPDDETFNLARETLGAVQQKLNK